MIPSRKQKDLKSSGSAIPRLLRPCMTTFYDFMNDFMTTTFHILILHFRFRLPLRVCSWLSPSLLQRSMRFTSDFMSLIRPFLSGKHSDGIEAFSENFHCLGRPSPCPDCKWHLCHLFHFVLMKRTKRSRPDDDMPFTLRIQRILGSVCTCPLRICPPTFC